MHRNTLLAAAIFVGVLSAGVYVAQTADDANNGKQRPSPLAEAALRNRPAVQTPGAPRNEEEWIVSSVAAAIGGIVNFGIADAPERPMRIAVKNHIWAAESYAPAVAELVGPSPPQEVNSDFDARTPLTALTADVLLDQNERLSGLLKSNMRSAAAHESAALLVGAFALRESSGVFGDVRPSLSRMAAHLAVARALRGGTRETGTRETLDGALAAAILALLVGHQRDAMAALSTVEPRMSTGADRAWSRALRLRITGDWRVPLHIETATLLERLEFARAVRDRVGRAAMLDFFDTFEPENITDWHRLAFTAGPGLEAGGRFTPDAIERELDEARHAWSRLHGGNSAPADMTTALNERAAPSPAWRANGQDLVAILDWGFWAAHAQRHLGDAIAARGDYFRTLGSPEDRAAVVRETKTLHAGLRLYPLMLRRVALTPEDYLQSVSLARAVAASNPEVLTAGAWDLLARKPDFAREAAPFPFEQTWFVQAVPAGTAFDLHNRSLRPGCARPPSVQQARVWAREAPYDAWTLWSAEWLAAPREPNTDSVRRAFGELLKYDVSAPRNMLRFLPMNADEQIVAARQVCSIARDECDWLAWALLREAREPEAAAVFDRWAETARDRVGVANGVQWLVRHYARTGKAARAESLARMAGDVYSYAGLETYAFFLDSQGRYAEAEEAYSAIASRYDATEPLGAFKVRTALRTGDRTLELQGWDLLRSQYPRGVERLALHALDATPMDGVVFATFGRRAAAAGLERADVIVGVDEWRVRNYRQFGVALSFRHGDDVTYTVWRKGQYKQIQTRVPERTLGVGVDDYRANASTRR